MTVDHIFALEDGKLLGLGGFRMIVPETAWCWVQFNEHGKEKLLTSYRVIRDCIEWFCESQGVTRLQAFVKDIPERKRLVEHLGFKQESIMKNFYGNEDALLYARVF